MKWKPSLPILPSMNSYLIQREKKKKEHIGFRDYVIFHRINHKATKLQPDTIILTKIYITQLSAYRLSVVCFFFLLGVGQVEGGKKMLQEPGLYGNGKRLPSSKLNAPILNFLPNV